MVIALLGFIGSGKGTVADYLVSTHSFNSDSFAAPLKDACAAIFGWQRDLLEGDTDISREFRETVDVYWSKKLGITKFTPRLALQLVGTDIMRNNFHRDIWMNSMEYRLCKQRGNAVISDARFTNELEMVKQAQGQVLWVRRGELPEWYDLARAAKQGDCSAMKQMTETYSNVHRSEWDWAGWNPDHVVYNTGTKEELHRQIDQVLEAIRSTT